MEPVNEIKQIRLELGNALGTKISQEKLAVMLGLTAKTIFNYETGRTTPPEYFLQHLRHLLSEQK